jgi:hypothetical protein
MYITSGPPGRLEFPPAPTDVLSHGRVVPRGAVLVLASPADKRWVELRMVVLKPLWHGGRHVEPGELVWVLDHDVRRLRSKAYFRLPTDDELDRDRLERRAEQEGRGIVDASSRR